MSAPATVTDAWELARRRLYLCTPDRADLDVFVGRCIAGGVDIVQLREKQLDDSALVRRATLMQRVCASEGVPFVLNDRPDLAAAMGADGVHVGQDDVPAAEARLTMGPGAIVGLSTHASDELAAALGDVPGRAPAPVDYLSAGPVVATPTKPGRPGTSRCRRSVGRSVSQLGERRFDRRAQFPGRPLGVVRLHQPTHDHEVSGPGTHQAGN